MWSLQLHLQIQIKLNFLHLLTCWSTLAKFVLHQAPFYFNYIKKKYNIGVMIFPIKEMTLIKIK